jgi:probable HAF family extracellular repeat protein
MVGLGFTANGSWSQAYGVSDNGIAVGYGDSFVGLQALRWVPGSGIGGLGDLAGGIFHSRANGVSSDGSVIVGFGTSAAGQEAFRWTSATGMVSLGISDSSASSVSGNGTTIVGVRTNGGNEEAFRWQNGFLTVLGDLPGGAIYSTANGVSADGSVVVGTSEGANGAEQAFRWTASQGMVGLGILPGSFNSRAYGVSADGSIVVGGSSADAFIWDPQQGMRQLKEVLTSDFGLDVSQWGNFSAYSISADGLTIVGQGNGPNTPGGYFGEAFRIRVDPSWIRSASGEWNDRSNWAFGINPNELHDLMITPTNGLTVTKSSGTSTIRSLDLRATAGTATLNLQNSTVNVLNQTNIGNGGRLTGNDGATFNAVGGISNLGTIDLGTGLQVTGGTINNLGLLRGNGEIASRLQNTVTGEIRVGAGQHMRLSGVTSPNQGLINVTGGTFEVSRAYVNEGNSALIYGRDASLRFNGGLTNGSATTRGSIGISFGTTDIYGAIDNQVRGVISVSGGANVTFVDDLTQNGRLEVVRVGNTVSRAVMFGSFSGAGGFVGGGDVFALGDLRPGNSPASVLMDGNLYFGSGTDSYFELGGLDIGQFDQILVTGELGLAGELSVSLIDGFQLSYNQEFLIANVGHSLVGQFTGLGEGSRVGTFNGIDLFISYAGGNGNDVLLFSAIPEPGCAGLLLILGSGIALSRNRRSRFG